jgi:alpha-glucosidase
MKRLIVFIFIATFFSSQIKAKEVKVSSPNKKIVARIVYDKTIKYSISYNGQTIIEPSEIALQLPDKTLGLNPKLINQATLTLSDSIFPVVKQKSRFIEDHYTRLTLEFKNFTLEFRVYNDAAAWRFITDIDSEILIKNEQAEFNFADNYKIWFPEEHSMMTHQERKYIKTTLNTIEAGRFSSLPVLIDAGNVKVAITESGLKDYPGMYFKSNGDAGFSGTFPAYPLETKKVNLNVHFGDRNIPVTKEADFIAKTAGTRAFPWRIIAFAENDGDLITNQIVFKLAPKQADMDFTWIKPGKVAWDWWNALNIYGVDFKSGVNTETYKYYIDFASKYGLEYIILDEGWYVLGDLMNVVPDINMEEIVRYGKEKNVGIILWVVWKTLEDQWDEAFNQFERWGIKGIKVDFMQRDDQWMVDYYWRVAEEAAKRHMLVDFHGSYKPSGLRRAFPNVITREGVQGLEHNKWSDDETPDHAVTIPFIRMFAGPMDYTPGAMVNAQKENFRAIFNRPMSQGTRCQQLAMYVVYESPLQMLADSPSHYYDNPDAMEFLSKVPTVWDETKVLDAKVGEYVLIARRNGDAWYIGGMSNWDARDLTVDLSFLKEGSHTITIWQDGINADKYGNDHKKISKEVSSKDQLKIHLAPGGGWAAIIE